MRPFTSPAVDPGDEGVRSILMPVLGSRIGQVLAAGELAVDHSGDEPVLRYFDHEFPVRPGTEHLPLADLVDRQWYRLAHWKVGDSELNYRRFFDVGTLAAVRVEDPEVFEATHRLLLDLVDDGSLDGLRIDHPDGLADPRGYLRRLADASGGSWVVVEKILEGEETLPEDWPCAGTTGYDALARVGGLFVQPSAAGALQATWSDFADGDPDLLRDMHHVVTRAKHEVVEGSLYAEVHRLVELLVQITAADIRLRDHTRRGLEASLVELLVAFDRYRAYVVPGEPAPPSEVAVVERAAEVARAHLPDDVHETLDLVRDLVLGREAGSAGRSGDADRAELVVRFQQTCGPVMAKGIEDTAFYRSFRLAGLNEVGGDPDRFGVSPEQLHAFGERLLAHWPTAMTTLSTHDTKRAEDARARLAVLSEVPAEWDAAVRGWHAASAPLRSPLLDGPTEYLVWQILVATWDHVDDRPLAEERLQQYLTKAVREAKLRTTWTAVDEPYEEAVAEFATGVLASAELVDGVRAFVRSTADLARVGLLGAEARAADHARRARRLPGHRAGRHLAGRPGQPPSRRPGAARPAPGPPRPGRAARAPRRREAARHVPRAAGAPRPPGRVRRRGRRLHPAAHHHRSPGRVLPQRFRRPERRHPGHPARPRAGRPRRVGRAHRGAARGPLDRRAHGPRGSTAGSPRGSPTSWSTCRSPSWCAARPPRPSPARARRGSGCRA